MAVERKYIRNTCSQWNNVTVNIFLRSQQFVPRCPAAVITSTYGHLSNARLHHHCAARAQTYIAWVRTHFRVSRFSLCNPSIRILSCLVLILKILQTTVASLVKHVNSHLCTGKKFIKSQYIFFLNSTN